MIFSKVVSTVYDLYSTSDYGLDYQLREVTFRWPPIVLLPYGRSKAPLMSRDNGMFNDVQLDLFDGRFGRIVI